MRCYIVAIALIFTTGLLVAQEVEPGALQQLRSSFESKLKELNSQLTAFDDSFSKALKRLQDAEAKAGNLQNAILVQKESEAFSNSAFDAQNFQERLSDFVELRRLQTTYLAERNKAKRRIEEPIGELVRIYGIELERLQDTLTKSGKLKEALEIEKARDQLQADFSTESGGALPTNGTKLHGRLEFITKAQPEFFLNGQRLTYRSTVAGHETRIFGKSPLKQFSVGDILVVGGTFEFTYRGMIMAVCADDESSFIRFKTKDLRILDDSINPRKVTREMIEAANDSVIPGGLDKVTSDVWNERGLPSGPDGGSEAFQALQKSQRYYWAAIITEEMIWQWKKPMP